MTTKQMNDLVDRYLDSKGLSNPSIRKRAARKVLGYMDTTDDGRILVRWPTCASF